MSAKKILSTRSVKKGLHFFYDVLEATDGCEMDRMANGSYPNDINIKNKIH